ncbi:putative acetyltransferase [Oceanicola granulosus HTCC2516]|uniref:Putative acetyltransferase n=1 Tax=Oceanicola granulosus (strain ATCC BAA-861 / DSM 15982 / KCTC 12143 / HTCC2516) TaxID=314256 RepID=Q2C9W6_OCEGH|nr:GNAT family N-acetyltransferase [Oceanicola granulosus]EAR49474.1 putative acetyltransferase [Oceanicola granulosus HTCC2516]
MSVIVTEAGAADWPALWEIVRPVLRAGDTYTIDPDLDEPAARTFWTGPPSERVTCARVDNTLLGTAHMGPNRDGPGAHIANASYMVAPAARGKGVGRALVVDSIAWARAAGYRGLQFNAVAESNRGAVKLYRDLGFAILGTVPGGFAHPREGFVGLHIMYLELA